MEVSLDDQIACVRRELSMREKCYPGFVQKGQLSKAVADVELPRMRSVLSTLIQLRSMIKQGV